MQTYRVNKDQGKIWHPPYKSVDNFQSPQFRLENFCIPPKNPPPPQVIHNEYSLSTKMDLHDTPTSKFAEIKAISPAIL